MLRAGGKEWRMHRGGTAQSWADAVRFRFGSLAKGWRIISPEVPWSSSVSSQVTGRLAVSPTRKHSLRELLNGAFQLPHFS
jgi:hypothetical protein